MMMKFDRNLMFKVMAVTLLMAVPGELSQALMIGKDLASAPSLDPVCSITLAEIQDLGNGKIALRTESCSGTLISPTEILLAAHCVSTFKPPTKGGVLALCGYHQPSLLLSKIKNAIAKETDSQASDSQAAEKQAFEEFVSRFSEKESVESLWSDPNFKDTEGRMDPNDLALIRLSKPSHITPLPLVTTAQSIQKYATDGAAPFECAMAGFGTNFDPNSSFVAPLQMGPVPVDEMGIVKPGSQNSTTMILLKHDVTVDSPQAIAQLVKLEVTKLGADKAKDSKTVANTLKSQEYILDQEKLISSFVMPGDSGGPLLCREKNKNTWNVVGVAEVDTVTVTLPDNFSVGLFGEVDVPDKLQVSLVNAWVTPDISRITQKIWSAPTKPTPAAVATRK